MTLEKLRKGIPPVVLQVLFAGNAGMMIDFMEKYKPFYEKSDWVVPQTQISFKESTLAALFTEVKLEDRWHNIKRMHEEDPLENCSSTETISNSQDDGDGSSTHFGSDEDIEDSTGNQQNQNGSQTQGENTRKRAAEQDHTSTQNKRAPVLNEVEKILLSSAVGKAVLKYKGKDIELNQTLLSKLSDCIVNHELGADINSRIAPSRFEQLAKECAELFPGQPASRFYIPRKPAVGDLRAVQPRGFVYDKYHSIIGFLRKHGQRKSIRDKVYEEDEEIDDVVELSDLEWLQKYSAEHKESTVEKWSNTSSIRLQQLRNVGDRRSKRKINVDLLVANYYKKYPCLRQSWGLDLILADFYFLHPNNSTKLVAGWAEVRHKLLVLLKQGDDYEGSTTDILRLLPSLFKQPSIINGSGRSQVVWKPSAAEAQNGFLLHVKTNADIDAAISRIKTKCTSVKKSFQPIPIVVGLTTDAIERSYVAVDDILYTVESPLAAVDCCFKLYHGVHTDYPWQSSYTWLFLQQAVYELTTPWDSEVPTVEAKVARFKRL